MRYSLTNLQHDASGADAHEIDTTTDAQFAERTMREFVELATQAQRESADNIKHERLVDFVSHAIRANVAQDCADGATTTLIEYVEDFIEQLQHELNVFDAMK